MPGKPCRITRFENMISELNHHSWKLKEKSWRVLHEVRSKNNKKVKLPPGEGCTFFVLYQAPLYFLWLNLSTFFLLTLFLIFRLQLGFLNVQVRFTVFFGRFARPLKIAKVLWPIHLRIYKRIELTRWDDLLFEFF